MAAKDYKLVISCFGNIYFSRKNKSKRLMDDDRRLISDSEILQMFEVFLRRRCEEVEDDTIVIRNDKGEKIIEAKLLDKNK